MKTEILGIKDEDIKKAAGVIKRGGIVVYPTESFYGLGADATNGDAVRRIFQIKKRDENMPILVIIGNKEMLFAFAEEVPDKAERLIQMFWPGALTIIFRAKRGMPELLHSKTGKIGIRMSGNPVARRLSELSGTPITGTSANISGKPPCRTVNEVMKQLKGVDIVLDGGILDSVAATTIIDVTEDPPRILRRGLISEDLITECIGEIRYA